MAAAATKATQRLAALLTGGDLRSAIAAINAREGTSLPEIGAEQVIAQNVGPELAEKSAGARYPAIYVYCEGLANLLKEKFRAFSGKVYMAIEVRVSHDRQEAVGPMIQHYVEAMTELLERNRGEWAPGIYFTGGYKVEFGPIRHGGKNFLQSAKIRFELDASEN